MGNVTRVIEHPAGTQDYSATRMVYARNGQTVSHVMGESWEWDGITSCEVTDSYSVTYAREFRYDGARQRYLVRELDPDDLEPLSAVWSDYDGDEIYADFSVIPGNPPTVTELRSYEPGVARVDDPLGTPVAAYYHGDLIGSTWTMSDASGEGIEAARYTAFGELFEGTAHRYGYAGAYGYQTDTDGSGGPGAFPFLHVGARYYDPATGRFLQRDPIGIDGGLNVYAYARWRPTLEMDPSGLLAEKLPRKGPPWWVLAILCRDLVEREVVPWLDKKSDEWYEEESEKINNPPVPPYGPPPPPPPPPCCFTTCFVAGTKVDTANGPVNIEELVAGVVVNSKNQESGEQGIGKISHVFSSWAHEIVHITVSGETIQVTPEHPFWVIGRGWVNAGNLRARDELVSFDGQSVSVLNITMECLIEPILVYNITVDVFNTFFIGRSRILVHNKMC